MKKKIFSCLMIAIVIVTSFFYAHIDKNSYIYNRNADTNTFINTGVLEGGEEIRQTFMSTENTIDGISLKVNMSGNIERVVLHVVLFDESQQEVSAITVSANELENNKFNKLQFPTVSDAKGKQFTLVLSQENSEGQNGISFYYEPNGQENEMLHIKDNDTDGTLVTRIICHKFDFETFAVLLGIITFLVGFVRMLNKYI